MKAFLATDAEVQEGRSLAVELSGRPYVLTRQDGTIRLYANVCSHLGGPLTLEGDAFRCDWHGACFDAKSGKATGGPAPRESQLIALPYRIEDGGIYFVYGE